MTEEYYSKSDIKRFAKKVLVPVFGILAMIFIVAPLLGLFIQFLWNATIADIFDVKEIGFWQAVGLFILAKFLFGFGGSSSSGRSKGRKKSREKDGDKDGNKHVELHFGLAAEDGSGDSAGDEAFKDYWDKEGKAHWEEWKAGKDE